MAQLEFLTENTEVLGSTEVAVSVAVLIDAIQDVTGSIEVCSFSSKLQVEFGAETKKSLVIMIMLCSEQTAFLMSWITYSWLIKVC